MKKTALITGISGQDGTFLTQLLLEKGYKVIGLTRRVSTEPPHRVRGKFDFSSALADGSLVYFSGDLTSPVSLLRLFRQYPEISEVYNLAAQSDVWESFKQPDLTYQANAVGVINILNTIDALQLAHVRFYQASTSEMFGRGEVDAEYDEDTPFKPASPYGEAKLAAYWATVNHRNKGYFACNGILFNHESEIRGAGFVTQKIVKALCRNEQLHIGNLDAKRDWGYAGDYVQAMHKMLQVETPDDYVIATGEVHSVREFIEEVAGLLFPKSYIRWQGEGANEVGHWVRPSEILGINVTIAEAVVVDPDFYRPVEVPYLFGKNNQARLKLGWKPTTDFEQLVALMVKAEKERLNQ